MFVFLVSLDKRVLGLSVLGLRLVVMVDSCCLVVGQVKLIVCCVCGFGMFLGCLVECVLFICSPWVGFGWMG